MKRILALVVILIVVFCNVSLAQKTPEEARMALGQINVPYTEQAFFKVIWENKDHFAVSYFIEAGMDPNYIFYENFTPLNTAAFFNNVEATRLLLEYPGVDVGWKNKNGMTALDIATEFGFEDIVNLYNQKGFYSDIKRNTLLSETKIKEALDLGKSVSSSGKNIIASEKKSFKLQPNGFFGKVELQGKAYWLSPECVLATHSLNSQKKYQELTEMDIKRDVETYKVNIIFDLFVQRLNGLNDLKIVAQQEDITIYPQFVTFHRFGDIDYFGWTKRGVSASFIASKINSSKPITIKIFAANTSRELTINFDKLSSGQSDKYVIENSGYSWE